MREWVSINDALALTLGATAPLDQVLVVLDDALGCVLAESVVSTCDVPPFSNSSMDGYAVRSLDTREAPIALTVIDTALAGQPSSKSVSAGEAIRIMTGAVIPMGTDAVCMVERTHTNDGGATVVIEHEVTRGDFVRTPGSDVRQGDHVFDTGEVLGPAHLGVLASVGHLRVRVHPVPRVGVMSTGDELTDDGGPLAPGAIRDSNRHALLGLVRSSGFVAVDLGIVPDDRECLRTTLLGAALTCDAVLTSGGVSMGDVDLVKEVLEEQCGGTMRWLGIAVKPAKPFAFGLLAPSSTPVFGLPGNPVSSLVSFELFARPALRQMAGFTGLFRPTVNAIADDTLDRSPDSKVHIVSVRARADEDGRFHVGTVGTQASHVLSSFARANALAIVPDGHGIPAGDFVEILLLDADSLGGVSELVATPTLVSS